MKTHRFDGVSFFSGLVITLVGLFFLIPNEPSDVIDAIGRLGNWFWPVVFLAIGVAVLIPTFVALGRGSDKDEAEAEEGP